MTEPDNEAVEAEIENEAPEEPLFGPDGAFDAANGRYDFMAFWLEKLGVDDPRGSGLTFGEHCSLAILHPVTGEWLTPAEIVKRANKPAAVKAFKQ